MTIENLAQGYPAVACEFDQNSIDERERYERAFLIGLINSVVGRPAFEGVIHEMLGRAEEALYFVHRHPDRYLSLATRGPLRIGLFVRRFGRQGQRETEDARRKVSPGSLARNAPSDKEDADVGLPGARENHMLQLHV